MKEEVKVWLLLYAENDYNQPDKAFKKLFWQKPTLEELENFGFTEDNYQLLNKKVRYCDCDYWIEEHTNQQP